jgi:hypothetical protein
MENAKIYGLCLERLKYQIGNAKKRLHSGPEDNVLLECYNTGEFEDIIDILELYDVTAPTFEQVREKLEDLAYTVSTLLQETLYFDLTIDGHFGLYLSIEKECATIMPVSKAA